MSVSAIVGTFGCVFPPHLDLLSEALALGLVLVLALVLHLALVLDFALVLVLVPELVLLLPF